MKRLQKVSLLVVAVLVAGALFLGATGQILAHGPEGGPTDGAGRDPQGPMVQPPTPQNGGPGWGNGWGFPRGLWGSMMGGLGRWLGGMMSGWGGMMGNGGMGGMMGGWGGMMGGWGWFNSNNTPLSAEEVQRIAEEYVASYGNPDLEVAEIMEFDNQFYVQAREESTGRYAFEFLIDRYTGNAFLEPGPNMMWNTRYGHMGSAWSAPTGQEVITPEQAIEIAQAYLDATYPGLKAADEADAFYGYYTIHTVKDGQVVGMLSVNSSTGEVWPHTWHGEFLGMVGEDTH